MFTKTHTRLASLLVALGFTTMMLVPAHAQLSNGNGNTNATTNANTNSVSTGAPIIESEFNVINMRTNTDATTTPAKPGDILRITAKIRNVGTGDLTMVPRVISEELFKLGTVIDPGNGGIPQEQRSMVFPQITLAAGCNCEEQIAFSVQLSQTMCPDFPALVSGNMMIMFQEKVKRVSLECATPAPVTPTPVTPAPTTPVKVTPPATPKTGPEEIFALSLALAAAGAGAVAARRVLRRKAK